jgi:hypothetical protein
MRLADHALAFTEGQRAWRIAALAMLSTRIIQGFIYWGGGSRCFIYAPAQLNPDAPTWTSVPCRIISTASIRVRDGLAGWACKIRTGESVRELSNWDSVTTWPDASAPAP